ncbi:hypothetical protein CASFOL_004625 [Castilleja foliolosa]|uniref:Protein LNK1-like n=1 Tax=Castilleja foliolosa TaxID=1961234 RepID=A0ABD3EB04_9LAMI
MVNKGRELGRFSTLSKGRGRELGRSSTLSKGNTMLEKDSLSQKPIAFTSASDSDTKKQSSNLSSDNTMTSTHDLKSTDAGPNSSEFCSNDAIFCDKTNIVDNNSFNYQLGEINQTSNDLGFLGNAENKDSNDFLYYGWPEIEDFEDIGGMLRSCNSTFDLGFSKDTESGWLSTTDDLGRSGDVDTKFPCPEPDVVKNVSENHELSRGYSINNESWTSENSNSCISFASGHRHGIADRKDGFVPQEQGLWLREQQRVSTNKHSRTGDAAVMNKHIMPLASGLTSQHIFPSVRMQQNQQAQSLDSYNYLQNHISFEKPSIDKSETTGLTSMSTRDDPYNASSQLQYMESSPYPPFEMTARAVCEQRETRHSCKGKYVKHLDPGEVILATQAELVSSNVQESSTSSSGFDDLSLEAASFRRLQLVMEQLDSRTKLCIRDGLYHLARSAEQRHNHATLNVGCRNERDAAIGTTMAEGTNNYTNPVDRSIAHLLFYQPSCSPSMPFDESFPFKSPIVVQGSDASPSVMAENLVSVEFEAEKVENRNC